jgi:outer membrane lipopolysaccharide assembly protein LptE/RlpB
MSKSYGRGSLTAALALLAATTLAACQTAPEPDAMARTTTEVAPADLQLLCASAAATAAKADAAKTLPISSARVDDQTYSVQVDAAGAKYSCTVGADGTVKSVAPAA